MTSKPARLDDVQAASRPTATTKYPTTRRIRFRFDDATPNKYFADGDMVFSHLIAGLSAGFPPGEESFIRSVRRFADQVTDPTLKKRVAGFIGQESVHGQEHRRLNQQLIGLGYPIAWQDGPRAEHVRRRIESRLPARVHLAMTAAAEHYTAVLAERILGKAELQRYATDPEVRHLLNWHAFEELEHKSVAFDVYQAVGGNERTRILVMAIALFTVVPMTFVQLGASLMRDPVARRQPLRLTRELRALLQGPMINGLLHDAVPYLRPGFHPDDKDTSALLEQWRAELFGSHGALVGYLK